MSTTIPTCPYCGVTWLGPSHVCQATGPPQALIAAAPDLAATVERLQAENERLRAALRPHRSSGTLPQQNGPAMTDLEALRQRLMSRLGVAQFADYRDGWEDGIDAVLALLEPMHWSATANATLYRIKEQPGTGE